MTILGGGKLYTIPKSARPDALAASRRIVKQTNPLRAAAAARADQHRPEAAAWKRPHPDANPVFDAIIAEPDKRRDSITPDVTVRHQGRHAYQRQIFNSGPHEVETYCFSDQHSMLLCMIASFRAAFDVPRRRRSKTYHALDSRMASRAFRRPTAASSGPRPPTGAWVVSPAARPRAGRNPISLAGFDVERTLQVAGAEPPEPGLRS